MYGAPQFSPQPYQIVTIFIPILWMRKLRHKVWSHACGLIGWRVDNRQSKSVSDFSAEIHIMNLSLDEEDSGVLGHGAGGELV